MCWPICLIKGLAFPLLLACMAGFLRLEMLSHNIYGHLLFQLCMPSSSNGEEACYVDGGCYLEQGFRGGTL